MHSAAPFLTIAVGLFVSYAFCAVWRLASGEVRRAPNGTLGFEAVCHVLFWTFVPPLWFGYALFQWSYRSEQVVAALAPAPLWLGVLLAILCLIREVRPHEEKANEEGKKNEW